MAPTFRQGMDSVDVNATCTMNNDSVFPPLVIVMSCSVHDPLHLPTSAMSLTHRCLTSGECRGCVCHRD